MKRGMFQVDLNELLINISKLKEIGDLQSTIYCGLYFDMSRSEIIKKIDLRCVELGANKHAQTNADVLIKDKGYKYPYAL